jgi:membrane-bound lytic murein transglycosylase D
MLWLIACFLVSLWLGAAPAYLPSPAGTPAAPAGSMVFPYQGLPEQLYLCGEPVPLDDPMVREELDREFTIVLWSRAQTTMWLKRANRYFPELERKIRARRLPLDLKYVVLVESDLRPKAKSPVGAAGPWQFMGATARGFQLKCNDTVDERLEFAAASDAALSYLEKLYQMFHSWPLALAAYNCGEGRIQKALAAQGPQSYYHLSLPEETERYVHRVMAAKIILEDPARYGYEIPPDQLYPPLEYDEVNLTLHQEASVRRLADACGSYYKLIKMLNPWIKGAALCAGTYRVHIPKGTTAMFQEAVSQGKLAGGEPHAGQPAAPPQHASPPAAAKARPEKKARKK